MNFTDLYRFSNGLASPFTPVEELRARVVRDHPVVHEVTFWECDLNPEVSRGHMVLELGRSSPYDDPYVIAVVRFARDQDQAWQRFVCCKELMHVFDNSLERVNNRQAFMKLMAELENNPLPTDRSPMFESERNAEWMGLLAICPQRLRDLYQPKFVSGEMNSTSVAETLGIPEILVNTIMSDRYWRTVELLTGDVEVAPATPSADIRPARIVGS